MSYDLGEITDNFNQATISLLDIVDSCVTRDDRALFETVKHKLSLMMNTDPVFVLDSAGKYIYKYRDLILRNTS
jgi:hypothetical protein